MSEMALQLIRLAKKEGWKRLELGNTGIKGAVPEEVGELEELEELVLSGEWFEWTGEKWIRRTSKNTGPKNEITHLPAQPPKNVKLVVIRGTQVADLWPIKKLTQLQELDCAGTEVSDLKPLGNLIQLQNLDCSNTKVADLQPIANLNQLHTLYCSGTQVEDLQPIAYLTQLQELRCTGTQVEDLQPIANFTQLHTLYCSYTQVADLQPIANLTQLQTLNCSYTKVEDLQPIANLKQLHTLICSSTLVAGLQPVVNLPQLHTINCSSTQVADLLPVANLTQLQSLDCSDTKVADLKPIANLIKMQSLDCSDTKVTDLKPIANLTQLQSLYCFDTQVADLKPIANFTQLHTLYCFHTKVTDLIPLANLIANGVLVKWEGFGLEMGIHVKGCPLTNPPPEIVKQGNESILRWLGGGEETQLFEAKVLLVGDPQVGKTTLLRRMYHPVVVMPEKKERTDGIEIHIENEGRENTQPLRLNVWDFGGQEIFHSTHQFFLTKRSVYVLVVDGSENHELVSDPYFRKWLNWITLLGNDSPILIFENCLKGHSCNLAEEEFKKAYPQVVKIYSGDLNQEGSGNRIREKIEDLAKDLPHVGSIWKVRDLKIRERIEERAKETPLIPWSEFLEICAENGERDEKRARMVSQYFHDLGICLHYQYNPALDEWVILDNQWATRGVFQLLLDPAIKDKQKGRFTQADMNRIWTEDQYKNHRQRLLGLMLEFELCYLLERVTPKTWLIPQYLGNSKPEQLDFQESASDLVVRYVYGFVPKGILHRLMARNHVYVLEPEKAWKSGVLFERNGVSILTVLDLSKNEVIFRAKGETTERIKFLEVLSEDLEKIHNEFPQIEVEKWIPCQCSSCRVSANPHSYAFDKLMKRIIGGKQTIECEIQPYEDVSVEMLINGFKSQNAANGQLGWWMSPEQLRKIRGGDGMGSWMENLFEEKEWIEAFKEMKRYAKDTYQFSKETNQSVKVIHQKLDKQSEEILQKLSIMEGGQSEIRSMLIAIDSKTTQHHEELNEALNDWFYDLKTILGEHGDLFEGFVKELDATLLEYFEGLKAGSMEEKPVSVKWKAGINLVFGSLEVEANPAVIWREKLQPILMKIKQVDSRAHNRFVNGARSVWGASRRLIGK